MKLCNDATRNEEAVAVSVQGRPVPRPRPINFNLVPKKKKTHLSVNWRRR